LPTLRLSWEGGQQKMNSTVLNGILMSVSNPYWIIWWATIGIGYIFYAWQYGLWGVAFFFAGHISADLAWYSFIAGAVARGRHLLTDRLYRRLIGFCALFLIGFAGYFAFAGLVKLKGLLS
ncbi:MAG: LysE family transporter, partial [Smithellaceae bacterium]|jgi:threonine/homoserine/homoserine lactone efflux protein